MRTPSADSADATRRVQRSRSIPKRALHSPSPSSFCLLDRCPSGYRPRASLTPYLVPLIHLNHAGPHAPPARAYTSRTTGRADTRLDLCLFLLPSQPHCRRSFPSIRPQRETNAEGQVSGARGRRAQQNRGLCPGRGRGQTHRTDASASRLLSSCSWRLTA